MKLIQITDYLLLVNEEAEIKEGNIAIHDFGMGYDLEIPCDKDNLKSNTRKLVVAYYPLTKEAKELDLPLLPNPFKEEIDIEKLACNIYNLSLDEYEYINEDLSQNRSLIEEHYKDINREEVAGRYFDVISFIAGYNAAQSKQFSLEDMKDILEEGLNWFGNGRDKEISDSETWFNHYIQSLSTQQLPKEFEPKFEYVLCKSCDGAGWMLDCDECRGYGRIETTELRITTNSKGKEELVGTYKY